jgi:hypothetical protein
VRAESALLPLPTSEERLWPEFLRVFPYARRVLEVWSTPASSPALPGSESYHQALDHYARAHTDHFSAAVRYHSLKRSLALLLDVTKPGENISRSQSLARVAWEMGERLVALDVLKDIIAQLDGSRPCALAEPFLAIIPRFEKIDPGEAMTAWCVSAALEQLEKLRAFSSYFVGVGALPLPILRWRNGATPATDPVAPRHATPPRAASCAHPCRGEPPQPQVLGLVSG